MAFTIELISQKVVKAFNEFKNNKYRDKAILLPIKEKYLFLNLLKNNFNVIKSRLNNFDKIDNEIIDKAINFIIMEFSLADNTFFNCHKMFEVFINYLNRKEEYFNAD